MSAAQINVFKHGLPQKISNEIPLDRFDEYFNWIKINPPDSKYIYVKNNLIGQVYRNLGATDKDLLTVHLVRLINFIHDKVNRLTDRFNKQKGIKEKD